MSVAGSNPVIPKADLSTPDRPIISADVVGLDLFGTLIDASEAGQAYSRVFDHLQLSIAERRALRRHLLTSRDWQLATLPAARERGWKLDPDLLQRDITAELDASRLFPDVLPALDALRACGFRLGLISNLAAPYCRVVDLHGLRPYFEALLFSCDEGLQKPDPQIFERFCLRMHTPPARVLFVGDSRTSDYAGALGAGLCALHLKRGDAASGDAEIASLEEIIERLA